MMAITKLISPNTPNPTTAGPNGDWDLAMAQLTACKSLLNQDQIILTEWHRTNAQPLIELGTYINHKGALFVVSGAPYTMPELTNNGTYFVCVRENGGSWEFFWTENTSGFAYDVTYNGFYNIADGSEQLLLFGVKVLSSGTVFRRFRVLPHSNLFVFGDGSIESASGFVNIISSASVAGSLSIAGGLVVNSPAIMAGGLTVREFLQYGFTRIDIPSAEDIGALSAGNTLLIGSRKQGTFSGTTISPFGCTLKFHAEVTGNENAHESSTVTVVITHKFYVNDVLEYTGTSTITHTGSGMPYGSPITLAKDYTGPNMTFKMGDAVRLEASFTASGGGANRYLLTLGYNNYFGVYCNRTLYSTIGETLSL